MLDNVLNTLLAWWNSLSPGDHRNLILSIVTSLFAACVLSFWTSFRNAILTWTKSLFIKVPPPVQTPPQSVIINVGPPQSTPLSHPPQPSLPDPPSPRPVIPRSPAVVGFVARSDREGYDIVTRLKEYLSPQKNQLVMLWGAGGVGKTTLAIEAMHGLIEVFQQRVVWTSTDGREDFTFSTFLDEIATQLGRTDLRSLGSEPKEEAVRTLVAAAPTLIVLDNFETIPLEQQARCSEWLVRSAPCPVLITSRSPVPDARFVNIPVMSLPEAFEFVDRLIKQTQNPDVFAGLDRDQLIKKADSNPLVLQWVVAQMGLVQEPQTVLNDLTQGQGGAAQRVFDRSFNLPQVGDDGRAALLALSLFMPEASRSALAEVTGFGTDEKRLNEAVKCLAALWLIGTAERGQRLTVRGLTRELAKTRLSKDQSAERFRRRFIAYFLRYADGHKQKTDEDLAALEAEKDNLLNAIDIASEMKEWESVVKIYSALEEFFALPGYWDEALRRGEQALVAAQHLGDKAGIARLGHNMAIIHQQRGELRKAQRLYNESLAIEKQLGNRRGIAISLHQLGMIAQTHRELTEARRLYEESLAINKRLGNQHGIASNLYQLGNLARRNGKPEETWRFCKESMTIYKQLGDQHGIASNLYQMGRLAKDEGNTAEAARLFREALDIFEELGSPDANKARQLLAEVEKDK